MEKIYDAVGKDKAEAIKYKNEDRAYAKRYRPITMSDFVLVGITNQLPTNGVVKPRTTYWTLNGLANSSMNESFENVDYIIIEPFEEQAGNQGLRKIHESGTYFEEEVHLSDSATIIMPFDKYKKMSSNPKFMEQLEGMDIALYVGEQDLATKMVLDNKDFVWFELDKYGFVIEDEYGETGELAGRLREARNLIAETMKKSGRDIIANEYHIVPTEKNEANKNEPEIQQTNSRIISGLTTETEGDLELDDTTYASISIGKKRKNQEDAVLLVKDESEPNFKMMVVADGMGGGENGELASDITVRKLKEWFENLNDEQKECYYTGISGLEDNLKEEIKYLTLDVNWKVCGVGGATLVCAIIGQNDTLFVNVGDSRAYIAKDGKLKQVSVEDSFVQEELEKGNIPYKDAMRFHRESNIITQCIGEKQIEYTHSQIIKNDDYDMILLFSDGVTDCLSDDDIALICRTSDKSEIAKRLVRHASIHDSIAPEELITEYIEFNEYIPGGKDNSTAAVQINKRDEER